MVHSENSLVMANVKKVIPWGTGLALLITKEAKKAGWTDKDYVMITTYKNNGEYSIEIKKVPIKK